MVLPGLLLLAKVATVAGTAVSAYSALAEQSSNRQAIITQQRQIDLEEMARSDLVRAQREDYLYQARLKEQDFQYQLGSQRAMSAFRGVSSSTANGVQQRLTNRFLDDQRMGNYFQDVFERRESINNSIVAQKRQSLKRQYDQTYNSGLLKAGVNTLKGFSSIGLLGL